MTAAINADEQQSRDNILRWLRYDHDAVERHQDGLAIGTLTSGFERAVSAFLPRPSLASLEKSTLSDERASVRTASVLGVLAVRDGFDNAARMRAGRVLAATLPGPAPRAAWPRSR